jgi:hypothetical protein
LTGVVVLLIERNALPDDLEKNSCATFCERPPYSILYTKAFPDFVTNFHSNLPHLIYNKFLPAVLEEPNFGHFSHV